MAKFNFNDSTPAAPSGKTLAKWQTDSSSPVNVSLYYDTPPTIASTANLLKGDGAGNALDAGIAATAVGTVTSVGMTVPGFLSVSGSPITTTGTLAIALATQLANKVFAGPSSGSAAAPTFRSLVAADLPVATTSDLGAVKPDGTTITISGGVISSVGAGSVNKYTTTYTSATSVTVTHSLGTTAVIVQCWDNSTPPQRIEPESIVVTSSSVVTLTFGSAQSGSVVVLG